MGWLGAAILLVNTEQWEQAVDLLERLTDDTRLQCPHLMLDEGRFNAAMLAPPIRRTPLVTARVWLTSNDVLVSPYSERRRLRAIEMLKLAEAALLEFGPEGALIKARLFLAWVLLLRPDTRAEGVRLVVEQLGSPATAKVFIPLAVALDVTFDPEPLERYLRRVEAVGPLEPSDLLLRWRMLSAQRENSRALARFLEEHETALVERVWARTHWLQSYVKALLLSGEDVKAEAVWSSAQEAITLEDWERVGVMIKAARGEDVVSSMISFFEATGDDDDLENLCQYLWHLRDFGQLRAYAEEACRRQPTPANVKRAAQCLEELKRDVALLDLLESNADVVGADPEMVLAYAQTLLHLGRFQESSALFARLNHERNDEDMATFRINLALLSGDWDAFYGLLEEALDEQLSRSPNFLVTLATLASLADPKRSLILLKRVVAQDRSNTTLLVRAGHLAVELGEDEIGVGWIQEAAHRGEPDSPVKMQAYRELPDFLLANRKRSQKVEEALCKAEIPLHFAAQQWNQSLAALILSPIHVNEELDDARRKPFVMVRHGSRPPRMDLSSLKCVAMDLSALLLAEHFGILSSAIRRFEQLLIPWETLPLLHHELRKARHYQPSQVQQARRLLKLVEKNVLRSIEIPRAPDWLIDEVGREDAHLLELARIRGGRFVSPVPIHRVRTFMEEEADIREYQPLVLTTHQWLESLKQPAVITHAEIREASAMLLRLDRGAVLGPDLSGPGDLYFDRLALKYADAVGLLSAIGKRRGAWIHPDVVAEARALVAGEVQPYAEALEKLHDFLRAELVSGKVRCLPRSVEQEGKKEMPFALGTVFSGTTPFDAWWIDDRFASRFLVAQDNLGRDVPSIGIWDVLVELASSGLVTQERRFDTLLCMRDANLMMLPVEAEELEHWLAAAPIDPASGVIQETKELRIVRQSIERLRSTDILKVPDEVPYLLELRASVFGLIRRLWCDATLSLEQCRARATWLATRLPFRLSDWRHCAVEPITSNWEAAQARDLHVLVLPLEYAPRAIAYREWVEKYLVSPLKLANPEVIRGLGLLVKEHFCAIVRQGSNIELRRELQWEITRVLALLPASVHRAVLTDAEFRRDIGFPEVRGSDFAGLDSVSLYARVREACVQETTVEQAGADGSSIRIEPMPLFVRISSLAEGVPSVVLDMPAFLFLHPDESRRCRALEEIVAQVGPTHPDLASWRARIADTALDDEQLSQYFDQVDFAYGRYLEGVKQHLSAGDCTLEQLVPADIRFFDSLLPVPAEGMSSTEYIEQRLIPHLRTLLAIDLPRGLDLLLPLGLHQGLMANPMLSELDDVRLREVLNPLQPIHDPISRLNLLDLCVTRRAGDPFFAEMASKLVDEVLREYCPSRGDCDMYQVFPRLLKFVSHCIRLAPSMREQPIYYQRLCAWAHTGQLVRLFPEGAIDLESLSRQCEAHIEQNHFLAAYLDISRAPLSRDHWVEPLHMRSFMAGRLNQFQDVHGLEAVDAIGLTAGLKETFDALTQGGRGRHPFFSGPLELETSPGRAGGQIFPDPDTFLSPLVGQLTDNLGSAEWYVLEEVSQVVAVPVVLQEQLEAIASSIKLDGFGTPDMTVLNGLAMLAHLASTLENERLAHTVQQLCLAALQRALSNDSIALVLQIAWVACASFRPSGQVYQKLGAFLLQAARQVTVDETARMLTWFIRELKILLPVSDWHMSQAEALLKCRE